MSNSNFNKDQPYNALPDLPPKVNLETPEIFKATIKANRLLAELKGFCQTLPNPDLLLNTIVLQESKESSEIENIVTTQDELYKATLMGDKIKNQAAKEVLQYREAMYWGLAQLSNMPIITTNLLTGVMQKLRWTQEAEPQIKEALGSSYNKELVEILFSHPYIKISVLEEKGLAKRQTASQYLQKIEAIGWLNALKIGREVYYINDKLLNILSK